MQLQILDNPGESQFSTWPKFMLGSAIYISYVMRPYTLFRAVLE